MNLSDSNIVFETNTEHAAIDRIISAGTMDSFEEAVPPLSGMFEKYYEAGGLLPDGPLSHLGPERIAFLMGMHPCRDWDDVRDFFKTRQSHSTLTPEKFMRGRIAVETGREREAEESGRTVELPRYSMRLFADMPVMEDSDDLAVYGRTVRLARTERLGMITGGNRGRKAYVHMDETLGGVVE